MWPLSRFLAAVIPHYATQHLPWAACIRCVMSLMLTAAPREYSYWTNFTFKNLWFRNVNLCHISQPEKWQSQERVSAFSQSPFPGWGFVKSLVEKMQMVRVEMSHSRSWDQPPTQPIFHHLGTELMEEGAVLQVIQLPLQYLRAVDAAFSSFGLPWQQMWHFLNEEKKERKKKNHTWSSVILDRPVHQI